MSKAVRYDEFGGIDVLRVEEVERPVPGDGQVLVRVKAAGINPSEAVIRTGAVAQLFPSTFPSGQGSDLAGVIEEVGAGADGFSPGDEVIGFTNKRASQAELVLVEVGDLIRKPENISWEVAGGLYVVGVTAWGAVHSVEPKEGETVVVSGAAGGVGSRAVQLARLRMNDLLADVKAPKNTTLEGAFDPQVTGGIQTGWRAMVTTAEISPVKVVNDFALDHVELCAISVSSLREFLMR